MKVKLSKNQWKEIGVKTGWMKDAQLFSEFDELELGTTPTGEDCAQVGSTAYDFYNVSKMEIKAFYNQLMRMFPNLPYGVQFKRQSNIHDFGTYYELAIRYDSNDEGAVNYAFNVENNLPEQWDEPARLELEAQGYFSELQKGKTDTEGKSQSKHKVTEDSPLPDSMIGEYD